MNECRPLFELPAGRGSWQRVFEHRGYRVPGENRYSWLYMGVGTGYTLRQDHTIVYNVAPRFLSSDANPPQRNSGP